MDQHHGWNVSLKPLFLGFIFSIILTIAAYRCVVGFHLSAFELMATIVVLGIIQAIFQLVFFLHLGLESKPRWNLLMFLFMVLITVILIGGSLWIMANLNRYVMPMMMPS